MILSYTLLSRFTHVIPIWTLYLSDHLSSWLTKFNRGSKMVNYNYTMMIPIIYFLSTNTGTPYCSKGILITLYNCSSASHFKTILGHSNVESWITSLAYWLVHAQIYALYRSAKHTKWLRVHIKKVANQQPNGKISS